MPKSKTNNKKKKLPTNKESDLILGHNETHVIIEFREPIKSATFTPEQAREMSKALIVHADMVEAKNTEKKANE